MKTILITAICLCAMLITGANAADKPTDIPGTNGVPDLTKGGVLERVNLRWAGPMGVQFGVWRPKGQKMVDVRQFQVLEIQKGSPADGVLEIDDVVIGADGTGAADVPLFKGAESPLQDLGDAITEAEAHNPALLKLQVWRPVKKAPVDEKRKYAEVDLRNVQKLLKPYTEGHTGVVTIKLESLGRYSDTAPYNCEKSKNILRKGIKKLYESNDPGRFNMGILCLLAADDPTNPDNGKYQARAKEWAHNMIVAEDTGAGAGWQSGVELIVLSEYYMKTKDEAIFPELAKRALNHARGVSWFGTTGHRSADRKPDGTYGGRIGGYGPINGAGTQGFLGLSLARNAGVQHPEVDAANERQRIFFGHFGLHSGIGYGEMPYAIAGGQGDTNGKHAMTALALGLQDKQEEKAKYFTKMAALSTVETRQYAHGGPFFGQVWQPVAAGQGGVKAAHLQFNEIRWHLDLKRSWDDSFIFDPTNNKYSRFSYPTHSLLFYALSLKQLYVTGRGQKDALKFSDAEFKELQAVKTFDAVKTSTRELVAELFRHDGLTRGLVANELVRRIEENPDDSKSVDLVDGLIAIAADSTATTSGRAGALTTLMFLKRKSGDLNDPQDLKMVKTMVSLLKDPDAYIRFGAVRMMQAFHPNFSTVAIKPYVNEFMDAIIANDRPTFPLDEEDPVRWAHGEMGAFLFGTVLRESLDGVDRKKMLLAMRAALNTPNGEGRRIASSTLDKLTIEEVMLLADVLVDNVKYPPPANSMGGSGAPQSQSVLAKHLFEEGLPLSFIDGDSGIAIENKIHQKYGKAAFEMQSFPTLVEALGDLMLAGAHIDANQVMEEMKKVPAPEGIAKLKRIYGVRAQDQTLKLPSAQTKLGVRATNYGVRGEDQTTYTWRKVYGAGKVHFAPNASGTSNVTTLTFTDKKPGKYLFEVNMSDTIGYNEVKETVGVVLYDKNGKLPNNNPPRAMPQSLAAVPGLALPITLRGIDPDGDDLGFAITQQPAHGTIDGVGGTITYTAGFGHNGKDSFTFVALDGQGVAASTTVQLSVSDQDVGVAVYEPFDYPTGPLHNNKGGFGFSGPWNENSRDPNPDGLQVVEKTGGENASLSYPALPSTGGRFSHSQSGASGSRQLDRQLLKGLKMLEPGGEMWFSFFFSDMVERYVTFSAGEATSFGVWVREKNAQSGVRAIIDGEFDSDLDRNIWSRSVSNRFPAGPNMVLGRCVWGKTDEEPDLVEVYRVFNAPGYDVVFPEKPVSVTKGVIPQEMINAISLETRGETPLDEIRVGPTRHSVLVGTKPLSN